MDSIANVSSGGEPNENLSHEETKIVDLKISSHARPKICTSFEEIQIQRAVVVLSDGSEWTIIGNKKDQIVKTISKLWKQGDDIRIDKSKNTKAGEFAMKNVREGSPFLVKSSKECADTSKAFFIKEVDPSGYAIKTNDGKVWITGYLGACNTQYWKEGYRVVINQGTFSGNDYRMINPNNGSNAWVTQVFGKD